MDEAVIHDLIKRYIRLSHDVWKMGEALIREEIGENLTNDQLYLLRYIHKKEKCTTTELAKVFFVQKSAISAIINRLVEKGLIERIRDQNDRRIIYLTLTDSGKNLFEKMEAKVFSLVKSIITQFDLAEIENFMQTFEKLAKILKAMRGPEFKGFIRTNGRYR